MKTFISVSAFVLIISAAVATDFKQCASSAKHLQDESVEVSGCSSGTCKLKKRSTVVVQIKFVPDTDLATLRTSVQAEVLGVPLPFIGVDGQSACDNLFQEDGTTKASCPLQAGVTYVYKNHFKILDIYPRLSLVVHWSLQDNKGNDVACFEVPAKIINGSA